MTGRTLGRYEVLEEISRGGMGVVYRGRDTRLNRDVALKVLPPDLVADPARRSRFVQEAQAASALEHPHIAVIYEIDEADGISFIAMELLRGDKLSDLTARGALAPGRALDLAIEIAEGLAKAHDKGIVHRDLKPSNVMLTEDGHAKIIDFGLAKLVDALSGDSDGVTALKHQTDPGVVVGTAAYMSPEQATGAKVDHRSDVFSFGVVVYEMLTGRPPFRGKTGVDTMHAILHDPPPPLPPLGAADASHEITRVLEKSLAKEPSERYQGMRDVVVDLRGARRRLESASGTHAARSAVSGGERRIATTREGVMKAQQWVYAGVALLVVALAAIGALKSRWGSPGTAGPAASAPGGKPSVAVLYFENNTGNPQLDWLRTGLTDMLVTDLSQSPDVEVLSTDRLVQILTDMHRQDDRQISFDTVQEVARRAGVKTVLVGSYVKAGDTIRINTRLQEVGSGRIVTSERVEALGESNLFPTVDDLTRKIKAKFALPGADPTKPLLNSPTAMTSTTGTSIDRDLKEVTTSSVEAYRYYAEGINLHERFREQDALLPLEKAVQIDPGFAMALAKLAIIEGNLEHQARASEYYQRAFEHRDRLTLRERLYVEGTYYGRSGTTMMKSIEAYQRAVELYPDNLTAVHNLAVNYGRLEQFDKSIPLYEELVRRGSPITSSYTNLAMELASQGQFDRSVRLLEDYLARNPDNARSYLALGDVFYLWGKRDQAIAAYDKSQALDPKQIRTAIGRWRLELLADNWDALASIDERFGKSADPIERATVDTHAAIVRLYHGRSADALKAFESALAALGPKGSGNSADVRNSMTSVLLARSQPADALVQARRAFDDAQGAGPWPLQSLLLAAVASARMGKTGEADPYVGELAARSAGLPASRLMQRHQALVNGMLAYERHDLDAAIRFLKQSESMAPPTSSPFVQLGANVPLWYASAAAYLAAGNLAEAQARFEKIVASGAQRTEYPVEYVRSWYLLGQIAERQGARDKARDSYGRFLDYWKDGDIDRDRVADAQKRLAGL